MPENHQTEPESTADWAENLRAYLRHTIEHRPGAKSALRRGLRRSPVECTRMHAFIPKRFVPDWGLDGARERAVYTVAALAGTWPDLLNNRSGRTIGGALGELGGDRRDWAERRLTQLCRSDATQMNDRLASTISALARWGVTVDLAQLARDLDRWEGNQARIVRAWVRDFDAPSGGSGDEPVTVQSLLGGD